MNVGQIMHLSMTKDFIKSVCLSIDILIKNLIKNNDKTT